MVIHQIPMERVHVWVWHEKLGGRQPTTLSQPPPATESHRQADFTPRAGGTWATENEEGRILGHAYQQKQCADNSCSMGAHGFAMMVHDSGHVAACGIQHASIGGHTSLCLQQSRAYFANRAT